MSFVFEEHEFPERMQKRYQLMGEKGAVELVRLDFPDLSHGFALTPRMKEIFESTLYTIEFHFKCDPSKYTKEQKLCMSEHEFCELTGAGCLHEGSSSYASSFNHKRADDIRYIKSFLISCYRTVIERGVDRWIYTA